MKYTDLKITQKIDELWGGGGVPDYNTMPAYKLKKASKNGKKFFVPTNEPTPRGVEAIEGKSPHKKGTKKYKKHMAAMHAESESDFRYAIYVDGEDSMTRLKDEAKAQEIADNMNKKYKNANIEIKKVGIMEADFDGKFIAQDFSEILKDPIMKLPKNLNFQNFINFLEFAMTDSQYKGMSLEKFSDNAKLVFSQWKANQAFAQADRDREEFKKLDAPITTRTPEGKVPSDADKWFMIESEAKTRLKSYPSKYQTTWALKKFKDAGGTWSN